MNTEGCGRKSVPVNVVMHVQVVWEVGNVLGHWRMSSCTRRTLLHWFGWLVGWLVNYCDGNWSWMSEVAVVAVSWRDTVRALKIKASDNPVSITSGYLLNANLECCCYHLKSLLTFWCQNYFFNFSTPVYKMWIIQEQNTLELWNKLHFEEEKTESI